MKPGGGGVQSEQTSLVVQVNPNANIYGAAPRGTIIPPRSQARHKLPMSPTGPRILPARNISALARPLPKLMSSPKKKCEEDDFEGIVERRPKFYKHIPIHYQYVLQDHNYCAMPPSPTAVASPKPPIPPIHPNGISIPNGIPRQQPPPLAPPTPFLRSDLAGYSGVTPEIRTRNERAEESDISSDGEAPPGNTEDGEETETAPEDEDSVTRCICDFQHDDGYMICCDKCLVWQHVDCMGIERGNIPEEYRCEECEPRKVDKQRAIKLQISKKSQFNDSSDSHESSTPNTPPKSGRSTSGGGNARKAGSGRVVARRRGERGTKSGRWNRPSEPKRGKYSKPTPKQKQKKTVSKKTREVTSDKKESPPDIELRSPSPSEGIHQLRQWIDSYEEAVTNHYSQELRARISAIKVNGLHSELRLTNSLSATPKSKVSLLPSGLKILVTTAYIPANQAIIEVRGKYMLSKGGLNSSNNKQQFVFNHRLNGPGSEVTEVQVDASTYGNDARFVRSSCTPNAEIRHCIEKGTLHLYIVSTTSIEARTEITLPHRPGLGLCASGDKCSLLLSGTDKRRRGRRRTLSESSTSTKSSTLSINNNNNNNNNNNINTTTTTINATKEPPAPKRPPPPPVSPEPPVTAPKVPKITTISAPSPPLTRESSSKATRGQVSSRRATTPAAKSEERKRNPAASPPKKHDGKLTREERKMEAIMKAFERLEKDEQRKQNTSGTSTGRARKSSTSLSPVREKHEKPQQKKKTTRETRSTKTLRPRRNTLTKSQTSAPPARRTTRRRAPSEETESEDSDGVSVGGSGPPTPGTPPLPEPPVYEAPVTPVKDDDHANQDALNTSSSSESTPPPAVSNACLLVAAAVGPLAPGFKFPKTKKNLLNSWFGGGEVSNDEVTHRPGLTPLDCAKKRWLRQAISEDSDSPKLDTGVSSPTEMAAPLKKRRFARESISSEISVTPPETPQASDTQVQIYEYDDNSMEPQGLVNNEAATPQIDTLPPEPEQALGAGPRTPPPPQLTPSVESSETSPQKALSPENGDEEKSLAAATKAKEEARVKRKLSISEYRERVKSNPVKTNAEGNQTQQTLPPPIVTPVTPTVDDIDTDSDDFLSNSFLFSVPAPPIETTSFKKGPAVAGFNAAPTLVEQQREALTERLRREFGLLLSDDEDSEKNKKATAALCGEPSGVVSLPELKKKRKPPPPPPPPLPPVGPPPPPPPPANEWMYYPPPHQYRFTSTF